MSEEEVEEKEEEEEEEEGSYGSREMDDCASGFESMVQDLREQHQKRHQWQDEGRGGGGGRGRGGGVVSEGELGDTMREEGEVDSDNQTDATEQDILKHQEREEEEEEVEEGELSDTNSSGDIETVRDRTIYCCVALI